VNALSALPSRPRWCDMRPEEILQKELIEAAEGLAGSIGRGWRYIERADMTHLRAGQMGEAVVEPLLREAVEALNPDLDAETVERAVEAIRRINDVRDFIDALRYGLNLQVAGDKSVDVKVVDLIDPFNNDYVVTDEVELRTGGIREPRLDVLFLVNGLPLCIVENKAPTVDLKEAAGDFIRYWEDAPELMMHALIAGIFNGSRFRLGATGATRLSGYAEWKDTWPHDKPAGGGEMTTVLVGALDPHTLVELAANYVVALPSVSEGAKILARYHQFRAVDKIVRRIRDAVYDRGIVWHTQGSGKTLTMFFAARKLRNAGFENPTVLIVVDRVDLNDQLWQEAERYGFADDFVVAQSRKHLHQLLDRQERKVIVTTVHKFTAEMDGISDRENVYVLADEAHRSHFGDMGVLMRAALPKAKMFAFTGTPVERDDRHSTRKAFSPVISVEGGKEVYEDYVDAYRIKDAIDDKATVEIVYEPRLTEWEVCAEDVDDNFEADPDFSGLTEDQIAELKERAGRLAVIAKTPDRIAAVAADVEHYLRTRTAPQGFKAQLVAVDREACVRYAEQLEKLLASDEFAVVMSRNPKKDGSETRRWYASEQLKRLGLATDADDDKAAATEVVAGAGDKDELSAEVAGATEAETVELSPTEKRSVQTLIKRFKDPNDPLKLLIVNNMLLTGFDAPVEQVMFLDRGLSGHNLLQAVARTNRPYPGKDRGVIVDYWGVFSQLKRALAIFNDGDVEKAAIDVDQLREEFPVALAEALAVVAGFPAHKTVEQQQGWLLTRLPRDSDNANQFEERFQRAKSLYETLAPDPALAPYLDDYGRLVTIRSRWKVALHEDLWDPNEHLPKSFNIVQKAIDVNAVAEKNRGFKINSEFLSELEGAALTPEEKAASIDAAIVHEIKVRGEHDPLSKTLAERLHEIHKSAEETEATIDKIFEQYAQLVIEFEEKSSEHIKLGLSDRGYALLTLARAELPDADDAQLVERIRSLDGEINTVAGFHGWQERDDVLQGLRKLFIRELAMDKQTLSLVTSGFVDEAVQSLAARADAN
jgi:type I restriction enzyme, R subunit